MHLVSRGDWENISFCLSHQLTFRAIQKLWWTSGYWITILNSHFNSVSMTFLKKIFNILWIFKQRRARGSAVVLNTLEVWHHRCDVVVGTKPQAKCQTSSHGVGVILFVYSISTTCLRPGWQYFKEKKIMICLFITFNVPPLTEIVLQMNWTGL